MRRLTLHLHYCEHDGCTEWGTFGYARGKDQPSKWYCREHKSDGEHWIGKS
ncbi:hypothetical protein [Chelativorans salis]|uniref:Uncharacterized protein n=1 Tax=Chelativorans salis TaxID=2978478 RepID=A0ABT2LWB7_9HYPH|nr:hypothetical protein [Chelativorans sp. EGI FJ00035]MCT7378177.1 hypothetical protein [Chelativorans sp. EGI FJ00035]